MEWSPEAKARLNNIPDFIQPMAKKEIERLAKEQGATSISAELDGSRQRKIHEVYVTMANQKTLQLFC